MMRLGALVMGLVLVAAGVAGTSVAVDDAASGEPGVPGAGHDARPGVPGAGHDARPVVPGEATAENATSNASNESVGMGTVLSTYMQSQSASTAGAVEQGMWNASFAQAPSTAAVESRTATLAARLERLRERRRSLVAARKNGTISTMQYRARLARIAARLASLADAATELQVVARGLGANVSRLDRIAAHASQARAAIGPPEFAGQPNGTPPNSTLPNGTSPNGTPTQVPAAAGSRSSENTSTETPAGGRADDARSTGADIVPTQTGTSSSAGTRDGNGRKNGWLLGGKERGDGVANESPSAGENH